MSETTDSLVRADLPRLACPSGCEFKVQALHIEGWVFASVASRVVSTPLLPQAPRGAIRLEVQLDAGAPAAAGGVAMLGALFIRELAAALHEPEDRLHLVELRLDGQYVIFDVLPLSGTKAAEHPGTDEDFSLPFSAIGTNAEHMSASGAALTPGHDDVAYILKVILALVADPHSTLYSSDISRTIQRHAGVTQIFADGRARALPMPSREVARLTLLAERSRQADAHEIALAAVAAVAVALAGLSCWCRLMKCGGCETGRGLGRGYSKGHSSEEEEAGLVSGDVEHSTDVSACNGSSMRRHACGRPGLGYSTKRLTGGADNGTYDDNQHDAISDAEDIRQIQALSAALQNPSTQRAGIARVGSSIQKPRQVHTSNIQGDDEELQEIEALAAILKNPCASAASHSLTPLPKQLLPQQPGTLVKPLLGDERIGNRKAVSIVDSDFERVLSKLRATSARVDDEQVRITQRPP